MRALLGIRTATGKALAVAWLATTEAVYVEAVAMLWLRRGLPCIKLQR